MKDRLVERLEELKSEYKNGERMLIDLERKKSELEQNLLRISGAVQILEEILDETENREEEIEVIGINDKHMVQGNL